MISGDHLLGRTVLFFDYGHTPDPFGEYLASLDRGRAARRRPLPARPRQTVPRPGGEDRRRPPPGRRPARPGPRSALAGRRRADRLRDGRNDRRPRKPRRRRPAASCCRSSSPASTTWRRSARPPGPRLRPAALACLSASARPSPFSSTRAGCGASIAAGALALIAVVVIGGGRGDRRLRGAEAPRRRPQRNGDRTLQAGKAERSAASRCAANRGPSTGRCTG